MAKKWYRFVITRLVEDMLRYDVAYIREKPEKVEVYPDHWVYRGEVTLYSKYPPTVDRWASFGLRVREVTRVPRPEGKLWTIRRGPGGFGDLEWVHEVPA